MIILTRHARNRLRLWKLTEVDVSETLAAPDEVTSSHHGRRNAWKNLEGRWLRVTFIQEDDTITVITATIRRRGPEEKEE
jgi:hypothetical protein